MTAATKTLSFDAAVEGASVAGQFDATGGTVSLLGKAVAAARSGGKGCECTGAAVSSFGSLTCASTSDQTMRTFLRYSGTPPGTAVDFMVMRNASATILTAKLTTSGTVTINDASGVVFTLNSSVALTAGDYWITMAATKGTTTGNGTVEYWFHDGQSNTLLEHPSANTASNTGTAVFTVCRYGKNSSGGTYTVEFDRPGTLDGSRALIDLPAVSTTTTNAVVATATSTALAPVVSGSTAATVTAVKATATSAGQAPVISGSDTFSGGGAAAATATASPAPTIFVDSVVTGVPATVTALAPVPVVAAVVTATVPAVYATAAASPGIPVVTATVTTGATATVATATTGALAPVVSGETHVPVRVFTPPTKLESADDPFWGRYSIPVGQSVVRIDGVLQTMSYPWLGELQEAGVEGIDWFLGGHDYTVTAAVADELTAAGYTVLVS